ncbi:MAG: hypothetical protein DYG89_41265 [Caldilinea sp. CFX5]|nr:hypothetical protein [Caldilinea sp. CFX5]
MAGRPQRISQLLQSEPITVGDRIVQPVARLEGWLLPVGDNAGGAFVRLAPATVTVQKHDQHYTIALTDPTWNSLRSLFFISGVVALVALFVMLLTKLLARRP